MKKLLLPLGGFIDGITPAFLEFDAKGNMDQLLEKLKAIPGLESVLRTVFRKSLCVMSYFQSRKRKLEYKVAEDYLKTNSIDGFTTLSEKKQQKLIEKSLSNPEWYQEHVKPTIDQFLGKTLFASVAFLEQHAILDGENDAFCEEAISKLEEQRKDILHIEDDDDESIVDEIKSHLEQGNLAPKYKEKLKKLCEDWEGEMDSFGRTAWYNQYLPLLNWFDF